MQDDIERMLLATSPAVQDLARRARAMIYAVLPTVVEAPWPRQQIIGYGLGPNKMSEHFGYLSLHRNHVDVGFNYGSTLPDPDGLLEGTGKAFRHVKIRTLADLERPALRQLLAAAVAERQAALGRTAGSR